MKPTLLILLLGASAALAQAPAQTSAPAAPQAAQSNAPAQQTKQAPQIAFSNRVEEFNGPTMSEVYCSGLINKQALKPSGVVLAGYRAPEQTAYYNGAYIYLSGDGVELGKEYELLRHTQDPNRYQSFPGQLAMLANLGETYEDLGRAKVLYKEKNVGVAEIEFSCSATIPGDIAVPFQDRPRPEFRHTTFDQFATPSGKLNGRIVMGKDLDTEIGTRRIVYLNIGEQQGVKVGDYFRIWRDYTQIADNPAEALPYYAPPADDTQKNPQKFDFKKQSKDLPRRFVGELIILRTTSGTATALTTYAPEDVHVGDGVEFEESTPMVKVGPAVAAAEPPTISCSATRTTIQAGETSNITCDAQAEEGHNVDVKFQASSGQLAPRENRAVFTGTAAGPATITVTAVDDRNLSAQTSLSIDVQAAPAPPAPAAPAPEAAPSSSMLNELTFKPNSAYVNNRSKAALDDDALRLQRDANASLTLEGSTNPSENEALAGQRAENAKTYLTRSKGIDPSRIQTSTASTKTGAKVDVVLVPAGAKQ